MLVRVLKGHFNGFGEAYAKRPGDEYEHPSPKSLIARGSLEAVDGDGGQSRGLQGTRSRTGAVTPSDGAKHVEASAEKGRGTNAKRRTGKGAGVKRATKNINRGRNAANAKAKG